ncbi:MAG: MBL fold metallo-hydrolase [Deltaproteobacteria bacterium]|nr:MBL fold metallo-hydrolase [Candidatus Anaeroferrophillacea bacterium]
MKITCIGGAGTVTGSCYLVEADNTRLLVDCGMFQGSREADERNYQEFSFDPATVSHLLLTHAHIDHSGLIPRLVHRGFAGGIICTPPTADLCAIMLADSAHIQEMEAEWRNRKKKRAGRHRFIEPLYTMEQAHEANRYFRPLPFNREIVLSPAVRARFRVAGHILGSAFIELWLKENGREVKVVFSGDLGNTGQPIIRDPDTVADADVVFIESTYGNRCHKPMDASIEELRQAIIGAHGEGGNVIVPSFAVGRTQELLYIVSELAEQRRIPPMRVFVDSPLAISATEIFLAHPECFDATTLARLSNGTHPLDFPGLHFSRTTDESRALNELTGGAIIIAAAGMANAGRIKHHLRYNLWRPEARIVFVGYQAVGTTGRYIVDGAERVTIFGEKVAVKASIHTIGGFSAHADRDGLTRWLGAIEKPPRAVYIVHGERQAAEDFRRHVEATLGLAATVPLEGDIIDPAAATEAPRKTVTGPHPTFEAAIDHAWSELDVIADRLSTWEDLPDAATREHLAPQLAEINRRLQEVESCLAGHEEPS